MADDPTKRGAQDRSRINVSQPHEISYWTHALGVTAEQLRDAVAKVGTQAEKVREYLGKAA